VPHLVVPLRGTTATPQPQTIKDEVLIVGTAVDNLLLGMREAISIWLALVGVATLAFAFLSALSRPARSAKAASGRAKPAERSERRTGQRNATRRSGLAAQARDQGRYAGEVAVAAGRAAVTAQRRRAEWIAAQHAQDAAWRAFEAADNAARRVVRADAFPLPETALTRDELVSRERHLHRAATAAYRRGELSMAQLLDVLCHRNGWDPRTHPIEQEATLRRIARDRMLAAYRTASAMERAAWQAAEVAAAAKRSLDEEAFTAAVGARQVQRRLAKENTARPVGAEITRWPSLAVR
jgi:hypothetical protein